MGRLQMSTMNDSSLTGSDWDREGIPLTIHQGTRGDILTPPRGRLPLAAMAGRCYSARALDKPLMPRRV
ncbi:hypothetical protein CR158_17210 [Halomonas heilongjiangensis]|nr:hypothetical protein CR158_17210 [Halomonas heilongjiangensis]